MRKKISSLLFVILLSLTVCNNVWAPTDQVIVSVPTLTEWGMMILSVLLAVSAFLFVRGRKGLNSIRKTPNVHCQTARAESEMALPLF